MFSSEFFLSTRFRTFNPSILLRTSSHGVSPCVLEFECDEVVLEGMEMDDFGRGGYFYTWTSP